MKTPFIIGISVAALLVIVLVVYFFVFSSKPSATSGPSQTVGLPVAGSNGQSTTGSSSGDTLVVSGASGESIQTKDFLRDPQTGAYTTPNYYYLGYHTASGGAGDSTASANPPYLITYIASTQYFIIELLKEPIGATRTEVESYLEAHLGISESDMCKLNYMLSVPSSVNDYYAGRNLGFSFCQGSIPLSQ